MMSLYEILFKIEDILKSLLLATRSNQTLELAVCVRLSRTLKIRLYTGQAGILLDSNRKYEIHMN